MDKMEFTCERCKRSYSISKQAWYVRKKNNNFICRSCHASDSIKEHWKNMSDDKKKKRSEKLSKSEKAYFNNLSKDEQNEYSNRTKKWYADLSDVEKQNMKEKQKEYWKNRSDEEKEAWRQSKVDYYNNLSDEEKKQYSKIRKEGWSNKSQEEMDEFSKLKKEWYANLTDDEKQDLINKSHQWYYNLSNEEKKELSIKRKEWWDNLSNEEKENHSNATRDLWKDMSDDQRNSIKEKRSQWWENLSEIEKREFVNKSHQWRENLSDEEKKEYNSKISESLKQRWDNTSTEDRDLFANKIKESWKNMSSEKKNLRSQKLRNWYNNLSNDEKINRTKNVLRSANGHNGLNNRFEIAFEKLNSDYYIQLEKAVSNNGVMHSWDYGIYNTNNELIMLVDLDGWYFHGDKCDYDGIHSRLEYDEKRGLSIPDGVKCCIIYEKDFDKSFEYLCKMLPLTYDEYIEQRLREYRSMPFPYPEYTDAELLTSYRDLMKLNCDDKYHQDMSMNTRVGDRLIFHFHQSLFDPLIESWNNDDILRDMIKHGYLYHSFLNKNKILQGFSIYPKAQRISILSAGKAKMIINKYLSAYEEVFCPVHNLGIMLACIAMNKRYITQCKDEVILNETNHMLSFLRDNGIEYDVELHTISSKYQSMFVIVDDAQVKKCRELYDCDKYVILTTDDLQNINKSNIGEAL